MIGSMSAILWSPEMKSLGQKSVLTPEATKW